MKCRGCEAFPKCTATSYGDTTCSYLRYTYGMGEPKPTTNADRIRAMTDEELVTVIACPAEIDGYEGIHPCLRPGPYKDCKDCVREWLQQPCEEVDHG